MRDFDEELMALVSDSYMADDPKVTAIKKLIDRHYEPRGMKWVGLPKDRDGKTIFPDDVVYGEDGKRWRVVGIGTGSHPVAVRGNHGTRKELRAEWLSHERPDSREEVIEDFGLTTLEYRDKFGLDVCSMEVTKRMARKHAVDRIDSLVREGRWLDD